MKIKNEPDILKAKPIQFEAGMQPHRVVLRNVEGYQPYVTHCEAMRLEETTFIHEAYYWGHYFNKLEDAEKDFIGRK